jgi:hypothetical protein
MLNELQNIRRLLTIPIPGNIRFANSELEKLAPSIYEICELLSVQQKATPAVLKSLGGLRSELSAIAALSQKATDYFNRLGLLRAAGFGAYERTGALRSLDTASRMSVQL